MSIFDVYKSIYPTRGHLFPRKRGIDLFGLNSFYDYLVILKKFSSWESTLNEIYLYVIFTSSRASMSEHDSR